MRTVMLVILLCVFGNPAAKVEVLSFSTPEHEARYKTLVAEFRCLVCQNQNIASSDADLAKDLREQVYTRIEKGESNEQIIDYMVARYGDFVLYKPPLKPATAILWIGPFVLLAVGILVMVHQIRSRRNENPISAASVEHARQLLDDEQEKS